MAFDLKNKIEDTKKFVEKKASAIDTDAIKQAANKTGDFLTEKANVAKKAAVDTKNEITEKLTELDRMLEQAITEYNDAYTIMNDKGLKLYIERSRGLDTIGFIESLINSIANHPKSFDSDFEEINMNRKKFTETCEFADKELQAARSAAGEAGAGLAAGAAVAFMAPTAAMWVATTFGTASTGVAISTLSGAAAQSAALAWLGGGAIAAGGGGMTAGNALLALAGPIGWTIAGATLLSSIVLFAKKRAKLNKEKNEEIENVKKNIEIVKELDGRIFGILEATTDIRNNLNQLYSKCIVIHGEDYQAFSDEQKMMLGTLVNDTKAFSKLYNESIE